MLRLKVLMTAVIASYHCGHSREAPLSIPSDGALPVLQYQEKREPAADQ
jgi:hypothetical protein